MAADNTSLGQFNLDGLAPASRGIPKIDVTFDIDASGILNVTANDVVTGKSQSIKITASTRLSDNEKERMVKEAEQYAEEDKKRKDEADALNNADAICYEAERMLADYGEKIADELKGRIEAKLKETKEAIQARDLKAATERSEALKELMKEAGSVIYAQAQPQGGATAQGASQGTGGAQSSESPDQRVVDAEYSESK